MSVLAFDFYAEDDPNGTPLGTLDESDCKAMEFRVALHGLGAGQFTISRHHADADLVAENRLVKVRIPSVDADPIFAFWLKEGDFTLISSDEEGGEDLTFGGPGIMYILALPRLYHSSLVSDQPNRGSTNIPGQWTWINEPYGAILTRIIEEGRENPFPTAAANGSALEHVSITFDRVDDSDSVAWPELESVSYVLDTSAAFSVIQTVAPNGYEVGDRIVFTTIGGGAGIVVGRSYFIVTDVSATAFQISETEGGPVLDVTSDITGGTVHRDTSNEFTERIGTDMLQVAERLREAGNIYYRMDPDLTLHATQTYGRDLTGAFASDTVRFEAGVNILTQLTRNIAAREDLTHLLLEDSDGFYSTEVLAGYTTARRKHWGYHSASQTNDDTLLNAIGADTLRRSHTALESLELEFTPGFAPALGRYMLGPVGTDGHVWVGDTVTLHTGTGDHEYDEASQLVTAIRVQLAEAADDATDDTAARSLHVVAELNYEDVRSARWNDSGAGPATHKHGPNPQLCSALTPGTETVTRLYLTDDNSAISPTDDAGWDVAAVTTVKKLNPVHQETYAASATSVSTAGGGGGAVDVLLWRGSYSMPAGLAAILAAGGAIARMQGRTHARNGIGINEAAQELIAQMSLRVTEGATNTIRGTALAMHSLASAEQSQKWPASSVTRRNRVFPPTGANNVLSAVSGAAAADHLLLEAGYRNFTVPETGGTLWLRDEAAAADLPEDLIETAALNPWIEIRYISAPSGDGLHPDLVGDDPSTARCDHTHHVLSNRDPTVADDITQGYPNTTQWTNTETSQTYLLTDEDVGTWMLVGTAGDHTHTADDIEGLGETTDDHSGLLNLDANDHPQYRLTTDGGQDVISVVAASGSAETLDLADGNVHDLTLTADCTLTLTGATAGVACDLAILLRQDATGAWVVEWPDSVEWVGDAAPTLQTGANAWDWVTLRTLDGGTTWFGQHGGTSSGGSGRWEVLMADGVSSPPDPLTNEAGTDWLYGLVA